MKRLLSLWLLVCLVAVVAPAQQTRKTSAQRKTTATKSRAAKRQPAKRQTARRRSAGNKAVTVNSLKQEQAQVRRQIQEQERRLKANERDVRKRLQNLLVLNNEIADKRKTIDTIRYDISRLNGNIRILQVQLKNLGEELEARKQRYMKSMRYMHRNRDIQSKMMFVFSARNFSQMYRRLRFVREYAAYQQAQGEAVKSMQTQVAEAVNELKTTQKEKNNLLYRGEQEKKTLESKQTEQQNVVSSLKKQQKTILGILEKQRQRDIELNARIDKMIAEEIARAKARAEAEARRKEAEARRREAEAAARRQAEELARRKAAAEAAARENERRIAEAKAREERAKAEARAAAARKNAVEKAAADRAAREAERERLAAERRAADERKQHEREVTEAKRNAAKAVPDYSVSSEDHRLSGSFESNRGRLPMPVVGSYQIVYHFGTNSVTDVKGHVTLDKKGIDIKGRPGAAVRSVFDGEVSAVFGYGGTTVVIIRHGSYLSVYCDLAAVTVSRGQKVSARQTIGRTGGDGVMQFQLRRGSSKLNPESWLAR